MPSAIYANMGLFGGFVGFGLYFLGLGSLVADFVILNRMSSFFYRLTHSQDYIPPPMSGRRAGGPYIWGSEITISERLYTPSPSHHGLLIYARGECENASQSRLYTPSPSQTRAGLAANRCSFYTTLLSAPSVKIK